MDRNIKKGSVIETNFKVSNSAGCLFKVTEVHLWGVVASMRIPMRGLLVLRLQWDEFDFIGHSGMPLH
jgi:hypothetical protein